MKALYTIFCLVFVIALIGCNREPKVKVELVSQEQEPDGFVDDWTVIVPIDPPPPSPFRFTHGEPINLGWVNRPSHGKANVVELQFDISMGTVGDVRFTHVGNAPGISAVTARIEQALNSWQFSNKGFGSVEMKLNFGSKEVLIDFSDFHLPKRVTIDKASFYFSFSGRQGDIIFKQ